PQSETHRQVLYSIRQSAIPPFSQLPPVQPKLRVHQVQFRSWTLSVKVFAVNPVNGSASGLAPPWEKVDSTGAVPVCARYGFQSDVALRLPPQSKTRRQVLDSVRQSAIPPFPHLPPVQPKLRVHQVQC